MQHQDRLAAGGLIADGGLYVDSGLVFTNQERAVASIGEAIAAAQARRQTGEK